MLNARLPREAVQCNLELSTAVLVKCRPGGSKFNGVEFVSAGSHGVTVVVWVNSESGYRNASYPCEFCNA